MRLVLVGCCLALLVSPACGGEERRPPVGTGGANGKGGGSGTSGTAGKGGTAGDAGQAGEGGSGAETGAGAGGEAGGEAPAGGPTVRITSPEAASEPDDEGVLLGVNELIVTCEVDGDYDDGSVTIELLHDTVVQEDVPTLRVGATDQFTATFITAAIPNGELGFRCSAEDAADPGVIGTDEVYTLIDHGPTITVTSPDVEAGYALGDPVPFEFTVEAAPIAPGDDGARVGEVRLIAHGVEIDMDDVEEPEPGHYVTSLNFSERSRFPQTPVDTVSFQIYASNTRDPSPVEARYVDDFVIDGEGPLIEITEPLSSAVIGGKVILVFEINDELSGVDEESIVVRLNNQQEFWYGVDTGFGRAGHVFSFEFNTTLLTTSQSQASIRIDASDVVGNASSEGASAIYYLDNVPPIVDLTPGLVREKPFDDDHCSQAFDPVGISPENGQIVQASIPPPRVLVWERTNQASGNDGQQSFYSGVDPKKVSLFLQVDPEIPLLIDTGGDGICDAFRTDAAARVHQQLLDPVPSEGRASYDAPASEPAGAPPLVECTYNVGATEPDPLCDLQTSDLTRIITQFIDVRNVGNGNGDTIYALGSLETVCTGHRWEVGSLAGGREGWLCLGAQAVDQAGNVGFSAPIALCYDDPNIVGTPACVNEDPPSCLGDCTLPSGLEFPPSIVIVDY